MCLNSAKFCVALLLLAIVSGCTAPESSLNRLDAKLDTILRLLESQSGSAEADSEPLGRNPDGEVDAQLARKLAMANADTKLELIGQQLKNARSHEQLEARRLPQLTKDMLALDTILGQATGVELDTISEVESEHQRLLGLLESDIPALMAETGKQAMDEDNYLVAQQIWNNGRAILDYFPSSINPKLESKFQELSLAHQRVGQELQSRQIQRYNQWATKQIRSATKQTEEAPNDLARRQATLDLVGPIDPNLLEPIALDLYSKFLETLKEVVALGLYFDIAEDLTVFPRKSLEDV